MTRPLLIEILEGRALFAATGLGDAANLVAGSAYNITLNFTGGLTTTQQSAFTTAAARWESIITGDLPAVGTIDDIAISASGVAIDGVGNILGSAGPSGTRSSNLPYSGTMRFDSADLSMMESNGLLVDVITHEMGHVLGIGTLWSRYSGLVINANTPDWAYTGVNAVREYGAMIGNPSATSVPVENVGGAGTIGGHWRDSTFNNELMTGVVNFGGNPLSRLTAASLIDLGYTGVNVDAADTYTRSNDIPVLGSITVGSGLFAGVPITLGVASATDANGIGSIRFYRESNGIAGLQASGTVTPDTLIGTASGLSGTIAGLSIGSYTVYARAADVFGLVSNTQSITLNVTATPAPGDVNGDGLVNFDDLLVVSQHYGTSAGRAQGDLSGDGVVNFDDLLTLSQNYTGAGATLFSEQAIAAPATSGRRLARLL